MEAGNNIPLVSIVVVAYNSEETITETLESVKGQSYGNIELIITDDCSKDGTVEVAQQWLATNKNRFVRTELLVATVNQGACRNCNKGFSAGRGLWIKGIAADDIMMPDCIMDNMRFIEEHPDSSFIASCMGVFNETFVPENCVEKKKRPWDTEVFSQTRDIQLKKMAFCSFIYAPAVFYKKSLFEEVGGFDERYGYEDWPFYINVLEHGNRIDFMDKVTVSYRIHQSQSHTEGKLFNYSLTQKTRPFVKEKCYKYYTLKQKIAVRMVWFTERVLYHLHLDKATRASSYIYNKITNLSLKLGWYSIK